MSQTTNKTPETLQKAPLHLARTKQINVYYNENLQAFTVDADNNTYPETYHLLFSTSDEDASYIFYKYFEIKFTEDLKNIGSTSLEYVKNVYQMFNPFSKSVTFKAVV